MHIELIDEITPEVVETFSRLMPQLVPNGKIPQAEYLQQIMDSPSNHLFAAYNPHMVGTLTLVIMQTPSGVKAWIEDVVVDSEARGQRIGEQLLQHAIAYSTRLGVSSINLTSRPERVAANKLYASMGFVLRDTNVYRLNTDEIINV